MWGSTLGFLVPAPKSLLLPAESLDLRFQFLHPSPELCAAELLDVRLQFFQHVARRAHG